jgi:hypothetical protein
MAAAGAGAPEDALGSFAGQSLRWAFQHLSLRSQVASVMEEMLATVEVREDEEKVKGVMCVAALV